VDDEVFAGVSVHAFAKALLAAFGNEAGLVVLGDEVVEVAVGLEDDAAAEAAVAAAGAAFGGEGFAAEGDAAFAAVAGAGVNFYFIDEHCFLGD
jgi:hypothetical protein